MVFDQASHTCLWGTEMMREPRINVFAGFCKPRHESAKYFLTYSPPPVCVAKK